MAEPLSRHGKNRKEFKKIISSVADEVFEGGLFYDEEESLVALSRKRGELKEQLTHLLRKLGRPHFSPDI